MMRMIHARLCGVILAVAATQVFSMEHPADGPAVQHVCAVAPDILSITLQAGTYTPNELTPYVSKPGDEIVDENPKETHYTVKNAAIVEEHDKALFRTIDGKRVRVASVSPDGAHLSIDGKMAGKILDESAVDTPAAYSIQSTDDSAYSQPLAPTTVFRKGKPDGHNAHPAPFIYTIALKLPAPLKEGATYTLHFPGVNTSKEAVTYIHAPRRTRSDAVHAIQTGYRPDDPYKRAYLSVWLGASSEPGKSGAYTHHVDSFELLDAASGKSVFTGKPELTKAADALEWMCVHEQKDYTLTAVHKLDFSAFNTPGDYQVYAPGIGVSDTFHISRDVWEKPFKTALLSILTQRQGIELGPPMCDFKRARAFHPDDGVEFYQLSITTHEGQEGERGQNMIELAKAGKLERVTGVWGGYQDAGDWDTLGHHLSVTYMLLELYELAPEYFATVKLSLPPDEQKNQLPDLLDEAMWQMPCFRRLQLPNGAVRGGYGEGWGCRRAQTSPMVKAAGVYAPDQVTTYDYAACAAKASRILAKFDKKQADEYLESATRAWDWADTHSNDDEPAYKRLNAQKNRNFAEVVKGARVRAAVELFATTRKPAYHDAFKQLTELAKPAPGRYMDQSDADFAYARLPDDAVDAALKKRAVDTFTAYADYAIDFSHKNAFEIINGARTDLPVIGPCTYFSAPGVRGPPSPICGLQLTKDVKIQDDGTVALKTTAVNIRNEAVSWDLWSLTRLPGRAAAYATFKKWQTCRIEFVTMDLAQSDVVPHLMRDGVFAFDAHAVIPHGKTNLLAKAFLNPTHPWIAAFNAGSCLVKSMAAIPVEKIHSSHAAVEIYVSLLAPPEGKLPLVEPPGLLELEFHSEYRKLAPGESMSMEESWKIIPYDGPDTADGQIDFLKTQGILKSPE